MTIIQKIILVLSFLLSYSANANEKTKVFVSCVFRYNLKANCIDFKNSFFNEYVKIVERVEKEENSELTLSLTDEQLDATQIKYTFSWTIQAPSNNLEANTTPNFHYPLILTSSIDALSTLNQLTKNAGKGLFVLLNVTSQTIQEDGSVIVVYGAQTQNQNPLPQNWFNRLENSPWYGNLALNGSGSQLGSNGELSYLTDRVKIDVNGVISINSMTLPDGTGGSISGQDKDNIFTELFVYTLSKNWSVAVINTSVTETGSNLSKLNELQVGVEWTLVPFRTTENKELSFRLGPEYKTFSLRQPNDLNNTQEKIFGLFAKIYFYWVVLQDKITMSLNAGYDAKFKYKGYDTKSLSASFNYQITRTIGFNASIGYQFSQKSLTYPAKPDFSNPLQSLFLSGQPGSSINYSMGINLRIGNSLRHTRNRRWAN